jgi:hypothetical protein
MSEAQSKNIQNMTKSLRRRRWLGLSVVQPVKRRLEDVYRQLPQFGRQPFTMTFGERN